VNENQSASFHFCVVGITMILIYVSFCSKHFILCCTGVMFSCELWNVDIVIFVLSS